MPNSRTRIISLPLPQTGGALNRLGVGSTLAKYLDDFEFGLLPLLLFHNLDVAVTFLYNKQFPSAEGAVAQNDYAKIAEMSRALAAQKTGPIRLPLTARSNRPIVLRLAFGICPNTRLCERKMDMDFFWLVPLSLAVVLGVWAFYRKVMRETGSQGEENERHGAFSQTPARTQKSTRLSRRAAAYPFG